MSKSRLYPFSESYQPQVTNTATTMNSTVTWATMTTYKPNPFHGIDRWLFALDEWQHRHNRYAGQPAFPWLWWRHPLGSAWYWMWRPFCSWWDRRLAAPR